MKDFLTDENTNELLFVNGDFAFGDSTKLNQKHLLLSNKGDYKQSPTIGVGINTALHDEDSGDLMRSIRIEMVRDGMTVDDLKILPNGAVGLNASYK